MSVEYIDRPPRIQPELPQGEIEIPGPPTDEQEEGIPLQNIALPLLTLTGFVLVSAVGGGRNLMLMIPMALSMGGSVVFSVINVMQKKGKGKDKAIAYARRLDDMRRDLVASHDQQRAFYSYNYPAPETVLKIASGEEASRSGNRLWERRSSDNDFGMIRLGMGSRPSSVTYKLTASSENDEDPQRKEAEVLCEESLTVTNVAVTIPTRPDPALKDAPAGDDEKPDLTRHAIGIAGENKAAVTDYIRSLVMQYAAFQSPFDLRIYVVGDPEARRRWQWAVWLPHTNSRPERYLGDQMVFDHDKVTPFWDSLRNDLDKRRLRLADKDNQSGDVTLPMLVVIVDKLDATEQSPLWAAEAEAAASLIQASGPELGAAIFFAVPDAARVPADCQAVIEVEPVGDEIVFRYAETGLNSQRFIGAADTIDAARAERQFAYLVKDKAVRRSFGDEIGTYIDLLQLFNVSRMEELPIARNWEFTRSPQGSDWVKVPLGLMGGNKIRNLYMFQDMDGVHGMIAGTTGSGKSELLLTLIAGIAIKYDPSVVNLALVDYKGGAAFEPFRPLPHTVDIVTNLQGNAVDRMFIAIKAELNRRSAILTNYNVKHLVEYRKKGYHLTHEPYPHLLIIVDEFAEMVSENSEFKARFDSITRLGRAIGVSLILATQRPTGAVTDQMRANMKYKICLRVETPDDSRELLRRSDAAFLPSNLPGRAYIQVGNENVELLQVARAGGPYVVAEDAVLEDVIWLDEETEEAAAHETGSFSQETSDQAGAKANGVRVYSLQEIADAINGKPETMVDWVVGMAAIVANELGVPKQWKPWPNPLPEKLPLNLPIDANYLDEAGAETGSYVLSAPTQLWMTGEGRWDPTNWRAEPLRVEVGVVDDPVASKQRILAVDLLRGPLVCFGAPGWGKTTFLRTMITGLAARHSPDELQVYALDFGKGGLNVLKALPHLGATIDSTEDARVERLLRMLSNILDERRNRVLQYGSLASYNAENPATPLPGVLVVVDNFGEFKENYEDKLPVLTALVRDGRAFGIYFAITASQTADVPSRLYNLFTERVSLKLPDPGDYVTIVGRGAPNFNDVQGRGVVNINRTPMEFQTALPLPRPYTDDEQLIDEGQYFEEIAQAMASAWEGALPEPVEILPEIISLSSLLPPAGEKAEGLEPVIGLNDLDRRPTRINLEKAGPHFIVTGPPLSGKSTVLRSLVLSTAYMYSPQKLAMVLIDPKKGLFNYGGARSFADLPHVIAAISEPYDLEVALKRLQVEFDDAWAAEIAEQNGDFRPAKAPKPKIMVVIDSYDDISTISNRSTASEMGELTRKYGGPPGLHMIVGGSLGGLRTRDDFMKQVEASRFSLILQDAEAVRTMGGKLPSAMAKAEYPVGRGFVLKSVRASLTQTGLPTSPDAEDPAIELDTWVEQIAAQWGKQRASWRYFGPAEALGVQPPQAAARSAAPAGSGAVALNAAAAKLPDVPAASEDVLKQMEELMKSLGQKK